MTTTTTSSGSAGELQYVGRSFNFADAEEQILSHWEKIDAFQTSLKKSEGRKPYSFYDGPPFATGLPHYGHILAGTIKDIVTRYAHQTGHHVERRFGWDCHGLPIEFEIEKELGIKTREEVLKLGIANYNNECRKIVMRFSNEWRKIVTRLGRWIDFDNDYKTMNITFMESVWWVFKQLFDKGLVYRGFKVMPYSTACTTPLSNFEANLNYKDTYDPAVVISFPLVEEPETHVVAWTTTPWTLPSNLALCVNPEFDYVKVRDNTNGRVYIIAEARLGELFKKGSKKEDQTILGKYKGAELVGKKYTPLFNFFADKYGASAFRIIADTYVTSDSGTGVVHCAPGFGEDDYRVCLASGIIEKGGDVPCPIDFNGRFTEPVADYLGTYVKDADEIIMETLKKNGRLVTKGSIKHSYPFCWRSDTPLIYRTVPSWFVRVEQIKKDLLANNDQTYWVPDFVKSKRFHNWLEDARDWAISRSRYWGTPIPIWVSDDWEEIVAVGSIEELEQLSGVKASDLHKEHVDKIEIPSKKGKGMLKRIEDVFDCWFESGSMPYAQQHYPFENKDKFEGSFPADFIAEGIDQTRGWFYTLLVLSTALFNKPPFKNLIVNGLVLAADGKKMSKRLKNYPDPVEVINKYGADALRLYLINSPVVRAENLKFKEEGVKEIVRDVFLPWYNAYRFFVQNARRYKKDNGSLFTSTEAANFKSPNVMDQWIVSLSQSLIKFVKDEMAAYKLYTVIPRLVQFIDQLTNWYVRMNRRRFKGENGSEDQYASLATLFHVLYIVCRLMAPFTPFLTESMYQNLRNLVPESEREESVHFLLVPDYDESKVNLKIETAISRMQAVIETGRNLRDRKAIGLKYPVSEYIVCHLDENYLKDIADLSEYIKDELTAKSLKVSSEIKDFILLSAQPENAVLGKRLKAKLGAISTAVKALSHDEVMNFVKTGSVVLAGETLTSTDMKVVSTFKGDTTKYEAQNNSDNVLVILNYVLNDELRAEGYTRLLSSKVQQLRKKADLVPEDQVNVYFTTTDATLTQVLSNNRQLLEQLLKGMSVRTEAAPKSENVIISEADEVEGHKLEITLTGEVNRK